MSAASRPALQPVLLCIAIEKLANPGARRGAIILQHHRSNWRTACHEAGHAIAGIVFGYPPLAISIDGQPHTEFDHKSAAAISAVDQRDPRRPDRGQLVEQDD